MTRTTRMALASLAMLLAAQTQAGVLLIGGDSTADINDVRNKIVGTGLISGPVDTFDFFAFTPTLPMLQAYESVLFWHDFGGDYLPFGDTLADYVDGGGGVVLGVFANASGGLGGRWASDGYDPIIPAGQTNTPQLNLGTIAQPLHPTMSGVTSLDGGTGSWRSTGALAPGATLIASWDNGDPLAAEMTGFAGRIISLNLLPPSTDSGTNPSFWNPATDGDLLMANSLNYAAGSVTVAEPSTVALAGMGAFLFALGGLRRRRVHAPGAPA